MKKILRRLSPTSIGITFTKQDREIEGMELGDVLDLSDMVVEKRRKMK